MKSHKSVNDNIKNETLNLHYVSQVIKLFIGVVNLVRSFKNC